MIFFGGIFKFYHYNYVENTIGQARTLRMPGLQKIVCGSEKFDSSAIDHCGKRSIYKDSDWGITAYFTIYGIESRGEAEKIEKFMIESRRNNGQERIPMSLKVYSVPRSINSGGPVDAGYIIFDKNF
jgi:hypothetical protein